MHLHFAEDVQNVVFNPCKNSWLKDVNGHHCCALSCTYFIHGRKGTCYCMTLTTDDCYVSVLCDNSL